jgi:mRNA interferase RelE/StbE
MWKVEYTKRFLKELYKLPKEIKAQAEKIVFEELLSPNPFELGYLEHMIGYPNKYKIRIGDYRIGITIDKSKKLLICQRVAHRKDIYRIFPKR